MRNMTIMLTPERIASLCRGIDPQVAIEVVAETGSTNADLLARIDRLAVPTLLAAERQTAGRGRAGRTWISAPGESLTFSLAWKFKRPVQDLLGLPLAVGVVIAEVLAKFNVAVQLKWPNDVLKDGKKLAGILIETTAAKSQSNGHGENTTPMHESLFLRSSSASGSETQNASLHDLYVKDETWAVIGIGLNIAVPENMVAQIGCLIAGAPTLQLDRNAVLAALLTGLSEALVLFESQGFHAFMARWNLLHAYAGQAVIILDHGQVLHEGIAVGVDHIGRLLLDTATDRIAVMAGDVSLRKREG